MLKKPVFSGHETFQCRHLWLKKGYDFVKSNHAFHADDAVVYLGVGKNMVNSIRYWMRAFDLLDNGDRLTDFAKRIFDEEEDGYDPFLEDEATLWLLHYKLINKGYATGYSLIFNELRKQRIEFSKEHFSRYVKSVYEQGNSQILINANTVEQDFEVFAKLYVGDNKLKDPEDIVSGILTELRLVRTLQRDKQSFYVIDETSKDQIPDEILLYALLDDQRYSLSVSLSFLETEPNSLRSVFALTPTGLLKKIQRLSDRYSKIVTFKEDAGVREIQFKERKKPVWALDKYYGR